MDEIWMISASAHALGLTTPDFKYPGAGFASDCSDDIEAIRCEIQICEPDPQIQT
jgi:hypothetical protein